MPFRLFSLFALAAMLLPHRAAAQGIDETINTLFADYTGWYVSLIFADLPGTNFSWIALWLVVRPAPGRRLLGTPASPRRGSGSGPSRCRASSRTSP